MKFTIKAAAVVVAAVAGVGMEASTASATPTPIHYNVASINVDGCVGQLDAYWDNGIAYVRVEFLSNGHHCMGSLWRKQYDQPVVLASNWYYFGPGDQDGYSPVTGWHWDGGMQSQVYSHIYIRNLDTDNYGSSVPW